MDQNHENPSSADERAPLPVATFSSCPYLGRRRSPAEPNSYASSHNVCYARLGAEGQPYDRVRRHYQISHCLEPRDGWATCSHFLKALAKEIPAPRQLPPTAGMAGNRKRRSRRHGRSRWVQPLRLVLLALVILLVTGAVGWFLAHYAPYSTG